MRLALVTVASVMLWSCSEPNCRPNEVKVGMICQSLPEVDRAADAAVLSRVDGAASPADSSAQTGSEAPADLEARVDGGSLAVPAAEAGSERMDPDPAKPGGAAVPTQGRIGTAGTWRTAGELTLQDYGFETTETLCAGELCAKGGVEP